MKELTIKESKDVQLELLRHLDIFCSENNIKYSLSFGSLIGVIRHKGYIPWDDDIDVFLLREEYLKLIKLHKDTDVIGLAALENDSSWNRPYAKYYDKRTICDELASNNTGIGLGIDVVPLDNIPSECSLQKSFRRKLYAIRNMFVLKSLRWSSERSLVKNLEVVVSHIILLPFSSRCLAQCVNKLAQKYNNQGGCLLCDNVDGYPESLPYLRESFDSYERMPFENITAMVAQGYDDILTKDYGNYMELPPLENQVTHHRRKNFWK